MGYQVENNYIDHFITLTLFLGINLVCRKHKFRYQICDDPLNYQNLEISLITMAFLYLTFNWNIIWWLHLEHTSAFARKMISLDKRQICSPPAALPQYTRTVGQHQWTGLWILWGFKDAYAWECSLVWPVAGITSMDDHTWFSQDFVVASVMRVGYLNIHFLGGKIWLESLYHYRLVDSKVNLYNFIPTKVILLIGNGIRLENLVIWLWTLDGLE